MQLQPSTIEAIKQEAEKLVLSQGVNISEKTKASLLHAYTIEMAYFLEGATWALTSDLPGQEGWVKLEGDEFNDEYLNAWIKKSEYVASLQSQLSLKEKEIEEFKEETFNIIKIRSEYLDRWIKAKNEIESLQERIKALNTDSATLIKESIECAKRNQKANYKIESLQEENKRLREILEKIIKQITAHNWDEELQLARAALTSKQDVGNNQNKEK